VEILSCLVQRVYRVKPQFQERGSWFLLHDNARPQTAVSIKQFLAKQGIPELNPPPQIFSQVRPTRLLIPPNQIHAEREILTLSGLAL
jgi:hypothetical protein